MEEESLREEVRKNYLKDNGVEPTEGELDMIQGQLGEFFSLLTKIDKRVNPENDRTQQK